MLFCLTKIYSASEILFQKIGKITDFFLDVIICAGVSNLLWCYMKTALLLGQSDIGVQALSDFGGRWLSCPKNLHNSRMRDCWNWDTNALKLYEKQTRSQFTVWREIFCVEFNFADVGFFRCNRQKKNRKFGFRTLLVGITFLRNSCMVFDSQ